MIIDDFYDESYFDDQPEETEHGICQECNGSGEGSYDGSTCKKCGGTGEC